MRKGKNSAVVIARLLGTEGFTDHLANEIERYWKTKSGLTNRQLKQLQQLDEKLSEVMKGLSVADRLVVGRFIGLHKKMSFETGLKIGLQAFAQRANKEIEGE